MIRTSSSRLSTKGPILKKLTFATLLSSLIFFSGCKKEPYIIKSNLEVSNSFELKNDNSVLVKLNPGTYPVDLNINSSRVKAQIKTASSSKTTFRLKLPKGTQLPVNGSLVLSPEQSGQPFQTTVDVKTEIEKSERVRGFENCTRFETIQECYTVGNPPQTVCHPVNRQSWGKKSVEYFVRSSHRSIVVSLAGTTGSDARITGSRVDSEKVYTYEGICF